MNDETANSNPQKVTTKIRFKDRYLPRLFREAKQIFREAGIRGVIKRYGWKFFAVFFMYYLIRDVTLYIIIPLYVAKKLL